MGFVCWWYRIKNYKTFNVMDKNFIDYQRGGYGFRDFENAYANGVEVYEIDDKGNPHLVAEVADKTVDDIEEMTETEFAYFLAENGVL